jgi:glycosyl-4,4'-diaponeurosporenoate acyltransferase
MLPAPAWVLVPLYALIWIVIHIGAGYLAHRMPLSRFDHRAPLYRTRRFERNGRIYRRVMVHRWKDSLPEAGSFFSGGFSKRAFVAPEPDYLERYLAETCRAEASHWISASLSLTFFLWNPWYVGVMMIVYGLSTNLPFIIVQRYNRPRFAAMHGRLAGRRSGRSESGRA